MRQSGTTARELHSAISATTARARSLRHFDISTVGFCWRLSRRDSRQGNSSVDDQDLFNIGYLRWRCAARHDYAGFRPCRGQPAFTGSKGCAARSMTVLWPCAICHSPSRLVSMSDKRFWLFGRWTPSGGVNGPTFKRTTATATSAAIRPNLNIGQFNVCPLKECAMVHLVASDNGRLVPPMHADDVDPMGIVGEEFRQCRHVVAVPGGAVFTHDAPNCLLIRAACQSGADVRHVGPSRQNKTRSRG